MSDFRECGACGETIPSAAQFCAMCGQRQGALDPGETRDEGRRAAGFAAEFDQRESQQLSRELFQAHEIGRAHV